MFYRAVILTSDVALLCGVSDRTARKVLQDIRMLYGKSKEQYVTVEEFSYAKGIPVERIYEHFNSINELRNFVDRDGADDTDKM